MLPQLNGTFRGWFSGVTLRVVQTVPSDFEAKDGLVEVAAVDMMLTVMKPQKVDRKPENLRSWKWWEGHSEVAVAPNTVLQDPDGRQYRVDSMEDWSQAGFYKHDLVEQPAGLGTPAQSLNAVNGPSHGGGR